MPHLLVIDLAHVPQIDLGRQLLLERGAGSKGSRCGRAEDQANDWPDRGADTDPGTDINPWNVQNVFINLYTLEVQSTIF